MNREIISKLQATLIKIDSGIKVFFNITQYQKMGLVYMKKHYYNDSRGNRVVKNTTWHLTAKAKQLIKIAL